MEIRCEPLGPDRLATEVGELVLAIQERAQGELSVMYGWAYEVENQWEWIPMPVNGLSEFLDASARRGIYKHGQGNLLVKLPSLGVEVMLCHESDIHIQGDVNDFLDFFRVRWLGKGIKVWQRSQDDAKWEEAKLADHS